jgi:DivIVA domain-containing protein
VDRDSIDRIRSATFPVGRRGYEKREVDRFLNKLADWLESGGGDQTRAELMRRDLERVGQQTSKILTDAHDVSEQLRAEAESKARRMVNEAAAKADETRGSADQHAAEARAAADSYATKTRKEVDATAADIRRRADGDAEKTIAKARAEAQRILDEGSQRRADMEAVISDLKERRDAVVADMQRLSSELAGTATEHRVPGGSPPSSDPNTAPAADEGKPRAARARPKATR